ncbi:aminopeptidase P family protein [Paracoccus zhejiangensis]|uniref:X-Pro aminopeptidase n=1 Tax=Paracoccus zhejiangensis TaxID=1077935 RepID=A0A2H5EUT5_9RHOB|nr:aminopeptidase P family protein [Paracoccus zhejiangensis]AUH63053.1 X-Pro aminopeptidase [Paracoccus zhejiangensis]
MSAFQQFEDEGSAGDHAARLAGLRGQLAKAGLDAFIVPRADAHQGEYVADADARLRWLTGFTGSAGFAIATADRAGLFVDGRYKVQARAQVDTTIYSVIDWPATKPADWLREALPEGGTVGFDPWLHTRREIEAIRKGLEGSGIALLAAQANPLDAVWTDRPAPPVGRARIHADGVAGEAAAAKRDRIAAELRKAGQKTALLTLPDSISWLLNIRGSDIPRNPVVQSFALLGDDGHVALFAAPEKFDEALRSHLGNTVTIAAPDQLGAALDAAEGPVRLDPGSAPEAAFLQLELCGTTIAAGTDPVILPKALKNAAELEGMRAAHRRDAAAMVNLLAWLDGRSPEGLTEIDVVEKLESLRRDQGILDISFDTICGVGPNAALPHYRVNRDSNRPLVAGDILLIDSGGQYADGTTDITRTLAIGPARADAIGPNTAVLRGMIALSRARFPKGVAGAHLDALARQFLWAEGLDFDHGTGHGVGAALCVHEGPARISRVSEIALEAGMILSNEPGYYREGAFGIRIENLVAIRKVEAEPGREMLGFETLTLCPIDRRLIDLAVLSPEEIDWLDAYHARVRDEIAPLVEGAARDWLTRETRPLRETAA